MLWLSATDSCIIGFADRLDDPSASIMFQAENLPAFVFPHLVQTRSFAAGDNTIPVSSASFHTKAGFIMAQFETFGAGELSVPDTGFNTFTANMISGALCRSGGTDQNKDYGEYE